MSSGYDPSSVEPEIYALWERGDGTHSYFHAEPDPRRRPYTIVIPPPNVTGALHLGHALNNTLQDILVRLHRMRGYVTCWLPGTDHAGIATQAVVEKRLREEQGLSRREIGRERLVRKIWEWKEEYQSRILQQLKRMGCSCDWQRERFTLDEQCARAVYETFFRFFQDGLIYRGLRLVNWDTQLQTAVADDEVYHETVKGHLWHIRYPIEGGPFAEYLVVATTRPETMLADTAVAVHPDDERYRHLHAGQGAPPTHFVRLPLMNRRIPIIADGMLVKKEFGTGCVKVTPGHDPNDYACWQRHQGQPDAFGIIDLLTTDGRINENGRAQGAAGGRPSPDGFNYVGMKKEEARRRVVADLEALGLLEKVDPYETDVGHSDRSKTPIEPLRSEQWFVRMEPTLEEQQRVARDGRRLARLAELAMEAVRDGRVRFFPERYAKTYIDWLGEKRDWCISRQLWWGHRIPVWTKRMTRDEFRDLLGSASTGDLGKRIRYWSIYKGIAVSVECAGQVRTGLGGEQYWDWLGTLPSDAEITCRVCLCANETNADEHQVRMSGLAAAGFEQDPDVLDTWFSSALWPHSTFGWPLLQEPRGSDPARGRVSDPARGSPQRDLDYFYPTSVLSTAREIITLWVARMVMTGLYNVGRVPFQHVYIHPVIQDGQGRPMKKSLGNGVDPVDIIEMYGADALRYTLAALVTETQDLRIPVRPVTLPDGRTVNGSERFELGRNLCNKLWQATTGFVIPTCRDVKIGRCANGWHTDPATMPRFEKWIRVKLLKCIAEVDRRFEHYEFAAAMDALRTFFWNEFCDWYIEEVKCHLREGDAGEHNLVKITLLQVTDVLLCLFHPVIPFITEALWRRIGSEIPRHHELIWPELSDAPPSQGDWSADSGTPREHTPSSDRDAEDVLRRLRARWGDAPPAEPPALIVAPWPRCRGSAWLESAAEQVNVEREVDAILSVIRALREIRQHVNEIRSQGKQGALRTLARAVVRCGSDVAARLLEGQATIRRLGLVEALDIGPDQSKPPGSMTKVLGGIEVYVPVRDVVDLDVERRRLTKEREQLAAHVQKLEAKLSNEGFVAKAPANVVESERARLAELRGKFDAIERGLAELGADANAV